MNCTLFFYHSAFIGSSYFNSIAFLLFMRDYTAIYVHFTSKKFKHTLNNLTTPPLDISHFTPAGIYPVKIYLSMTDFRIVLSE